MPSLPGLGAFVQYSTSLLCLPLTCDLQFQQPICAFPFAAACAIYFAFSSQRDWPGPGIQPTGNLCKLDGAIVCLCAFTCTDLFEFSIKAGASFVLERRRKRANTRRPRTRPPCRLVRKPRRWSGYLWKRWCSAVWPNTGWSNCRAEDGTLEQPVCASTAATDTKSRTTLLFNLVWMWFGGVW